MHAFQFSPFPLDSLSLENPRLLLLLPHDLVVVSNLHLFLSSSSPSSPSPSSPSSASPSSPSPVSLIPLAGISISICPSRPLQLSLSSASISVVASFSISVHRRLPRPPRRHLFDCRLHRPLSTSICFQNPCNLERGKRKAAKYVEFDSTFNDEQKKLGKIFKVTCNLNSATCKLKLKQYREAAKLYSKVLDLESHNIKALYQRAEAYIEVTEFDPAEVDLRKTLEIDPYNG
ncbi:hypothetical protein ACLOJK_023377 [Asimina triloba]